MSHRARWAIVLALAVGGCAGLGLCGAGAEGTVFVDQNKNGRFDAGEPGVAGAVVSDGTDVARTDEAGRFTLSPHSGARFVFLSTPDGMRPTAGWYRAVTGSGTYAFPLEARAQSGPLVFAQLSDIHYAPDAEAFSHAFADREMAFTPDATLDGLVAEIGTLAPDFVILTGDIIANAKGPELDEVASWFAAMGAFAARFSVPVYAAPGNHDPVRDPAIDKALYEEQFGPPYYSFNVKGTHCVVLDLHVLTGTAQTYTISAAQLEWVRQDLATVDASAPLLVFCHEPTPDWAATAENEALFTLLADARITALLNGHWHTNYVVREEPFLEVTSAAVCGAWWEGPNPDGTEFGYRVHELARGRLDSTWRTVGKTVVSFESPAPAALAWADRLAASVWGRATAATVRWDAGAETGVRVASNGLWTTAASNLNVTPLAAGYHTLSVSFTMASGTKVQGQQAFLVLQPNLSLAEIMAHPEVFQGKLVGVSNLEVRAVMGTDLSVTDGTKTVIASKFPLTVAKGDRVALTGMYRPTSVDPIKTFDPIFSVKLEKQ